MSPPTDEQLRLASTLGAIQAGVASLDKKVDLMVHDIRGLVRKEDCALHMSEVNTSVRSALSVATEAGLRASHAARRAAKAYSGVEEVTGSLKKPTLWDHMVARSRDIMTVLAFLGMLGTGALAVSRLVARLDQVQAQATTSSKLLRALGKPDAGSP